MRPVGSAGGRLFSGTQAQVNGVTGRQWRGIGALTGRGFGGRSAEDGLGELAPVIVGEHLDCVRHLTHMRRALHTARAFVGLLKPWRQEGDQDHQHSDRNQQIDERESPGADSRGRNCGRVLCVYGMVPSDLSHPDPMSVGLGTI